MPTDIPEDAWTGEADQNAIDYANWQLERRRRAITLTQPWATLVAIKEKRWETRSWSTNYRGRLAIHAAKGLSSVGGIAGLQAICRDDPVFHAVLQAAGIRRIGELPLGAIVAVADLVDILPAEEALATMEPLRRAREQHFGNYALGRYAWRLGHIKQLFTPIPCKGALGLWEVPAEINDLIDALP